MMAAVLGGFAAVAAANTLVMTVLDRRRELSTLRLVGSTRRQVLRMLRWEEPAGLGGGRGPGDSHRHGDAVIGGTLAAPRCGPTDQPVLRACRATGPRAPPVSGSEAAVGVAAYARARRRVSVCSASPAASRPGSRSRSVVVARNSRPR